LAALLGVVGPGMLAGLSDDDPAGVTTYSILGTDFGYQLLWAILISTALLILFHLLAPGLRGTPSRGVGCLSRASRTSWWASRALPARKLFALPIIQKRRKGDNPSPLDHTPKPDGAMLYLSAEKSYGGQNCRCVAASRAPPRLFRKGER